MEDDLLKEIWRIREEIAAECGYDVTRLAALVRGEELKAGKRLVRASKARRSQANGRRSTR